MAGLIYGLCAVTAFLCAWLLFKAYHSSRYRLLLWGSLCFCGMTLTNVILIVDKVYTDPSVDLSTWRFVVTLLSLLIFLYGLIWETE